MGVASLPLNPIGDIENKSGKFSLDDAGHEFFQTSNKILVTFKRLYLMSTCLKSIGNSFNCLFTDDLSVRNAKKINDIMPPSAYLFLIYRSDLLKDINFNPQSMEYPTLLDEFDIARKMAMGVEVEGREKSRGSG